MTAKQTEEMKKYIGPREVWAEPMTEYEAIAAGIHPKPEDGHVLKAGYKITQPVPNGRVLEYWVDEDTFNRCYTQFNSSEDRLRVEIEEVQRRIQSWMLFDEPVPKPNEENLWRLQHDMLRAYVRILEMRLEIIKSEKERED